MFVRIKKSHGYKYLQIVESKREGKKVKQRVLTTLGQIDALSASGKIDDLTRSLAKFSSLRRSSMPTARAASKRAVPCPSVPPLSSSDCGSSWESMR